MEPIKELNLLDHNWGKNQGLDPCVDMYRETQAEFVVCMDDSLDTCRVTG